MGNNEPSAGKKIVRKESEREVDERKKKVSLSLSLYLFFLEEKRKGTDEKEINTGKAKAGRQKFLQAAISFFGSESRCLSCSRQLTLIKKFFCSGARDFIASHIRRAYRNAQSHIEAIETFRGRA